MKSSLQSWQIPRKPLSNPPGRLSKGIFRILYRIVEPLKSWYVRLETEQTLSSFKSVGERPIINGPITVYSPEMVELGDDVSINPYLVVFAAGGLTIRNHVHFGMNVRIITENHNYQTPECLPYDKTRIKKSVLINDCAWIGDSVCIVPGVTIGEGAVIAMGSVVTKDVPSLAVVGGSPASIIKMRDPESYWKLKHEGKFINWPYTTENPKP